MNTKKPFRAKRKFGQNFLINENIATKIVDSINYKKYDEVLEIGPGMGSYLNT